MVELLERLAAEAGSGSAGAESEGPDRVATTHRGERTIDSHFTRLITHFEPGNLLVFEDGNLVAADLRAATRRDYGRSEIDPYPGTFSPTNWYSGLSNQLRP